MSKQIITQERLKEALNYCQITGTLTCRTNRGSRAKIGMIAGTLMAQGHVRICIDSVYYMAHKLIWLMEYGYIPNEIDHINHNGKDNRLENLREVTHKINSRNQTKRKTSTSGINGVHWYKQTKRWQAHIMVDGKRIHLGFFKDINKAKEARIAADIKYGFHDNHGLSAS